MKIFELKNRKYAIRCPKCYELAKFQFNTNLLMLEGGCKNNHTFNDISISSFINNFVQKIFCSKNFVDLNKNNIIKKCYFCKKNLTCNCILDKTNKDFCPIHDYKYDLFYENEICNLCEKCKKSFIYIEKKS